MNSQYVIPPPSVPEFMYKFSVIAWLALIIWAKKEYAARLRFCARNGYKKQWMWLHENSSAIHVLAEMPGYRKFCAIMTERVWNTFSRPDRHFFQASYELRDLLLR